MADQGKLMTKAEIAVYLGITVEDISVLADRFTDWLDVGARRIDKIHDEDDVQIFTLISQSISHQGKNASLIQNINLLERILLSSPLANSIRHKRQLEKARPEIARWEVVSTNGIYLRDEYKWLEPLQSFVDSIADFGCWASEEWSTCSEPYALLWTLEASGVVVIDKNPEYIKNAQEWLKTTRLKNLYFKDYSLEFIVGDMTKNELQAKLPGNNFDLSFCQNVLYNMYDDSEEIQNAVNEMARVVKPGGWIIAIEPKVGVEFKNVPFWGEISVPMPVSNPVDISSLFAVAGLIRVNIDNAPNWSYCYKKP